MRPLDTAVEAQRRQVARALNHPWLLAHGRWAAAAHDQLVEHFLGVLAVQAGVVHRTFS